jgi:transcriptional regulator with XRE-family HTH domain
MEHGVPHANQNLAEHLRTLRLDRGLTLQGLATESGVSRATLSRIENGEVSPTAETLGRLATAFSLPLSQLLAPMEQGFSALTLQLQFFKVGVSCCGLMSPSEC